MTIERINVYKIKNTVTRFADFIKNKDSKKRNLPALQDLTIPPIVGFDGTIIAKAAFKEVGGSQKTANDIPWLAFINQTKPGGSQFGFSWTNKFPSAIVAIQITVGSTSTFYALAFGLAGDSFLDHDMIVHDFGIKVAMNICDDNELQRIQTSIHEAVSTQTERQISSNSNLSTFNINGEKEFLRMLAGATRDEFSYISSFKGKESIFLKIDKNEPLTWETLIPRLHQLGEESLSDGYKSIFTEYDKFPFVTDPEVIKELDNLLFSKIKEGIYDKIHLSPPEFFDYDNFLFMYAHEENSRKYEELILTDLISQRKRKFKTDADIDSIKGVKISLYDVTTETVSKNKWSAYKCLVAELDKGNETFILSIGQWRKVSGNLLQEVTDFVATVLLSNPAYLPENIPIWNPQAKGGKNGKPFIGENQEAVYNQTAARESRELFLFDKGRIEIAGEKKYEVCDLFHQDKKFIQVKRFSAGAASISHLFLQARFYAEAFLCDSKCRKSMRAHIVDNANGRDINPFVTCMPDDRTAIKADDYSICLCLLTDRNGLTISDLPFMSKYELMHTLRHLTNMGLRHEIIIRKVAFGTALESAEELQQEEVA